LPASAASGKLFQVTSHRTMNILNAHRNEIPVYLRDLLETT
jgi:hypothetical protein